MIDERFAMRVTSWLHRSDRQARRPNDNVARALEQIHHTRQRRRWLWFLPGPKPTAGATGPVRGTEPADSQTELQERTKLMFTPVKLIGITAIIMLAGALALALPVTDDAVTPPSDAPAHPTEIAPLEGTLSILSEDDYGTVENHDWGTIITDQLWSGRYDLDDDRLDGYARARLNGHQIRSGGVPMSVTQYIENDGGSWVGAGHAWSGVGNGGWHHRFVLEGQGGYDGLTAILSADQDYQSGSLQVSGVVFDGGLPPVPGPAPTIIEE